MYIEEMAPLTLVQVITLPIQSGDSGDRYRIRTLKDASEGTGRGADVDIKPTVRLPHPFGSTFSF